MDLLTIGQELVENAILTVVGRRLHCVRLCSRISHIRQEVNTGLHQCDLETERIMTGSVEQMETGLAEQTVQRPIPVVQVILIQLVYSIHNNMHTDHLMTIFQVNLG